MKNYILLFLSILFLACKNETPKGSLDLNEVDKIRILSYPSRMYWEINHNSEIRNIDSIISCDKIIDDKIIQSDQKEDLISLLNDDYYFKSQAACYEPRHLILFYDNRDVIVGHYEMCLECGGGSGSQNLSYLPSFCIEKGDDFLSFFKKLDLKNLGENSKIVIDKEDELKEIIYKKNDEFRKR